MDSMNTKKNTDLAASCRHTILFTRKLHAAQ